MRRLSKAMVGALAAAAVMAAPAGASVQVSQSGWQWGNPTPQGNTIRAMDFNAGVGYAIGDDGTALRTNDGGSTWTGLATGTSQDLTRVQAVTPDVVVVLGGGGCVVAPLRRRRQDLPQDVRAGRDQLPRQGRGGVLRLARRSATCCSRTATSCAPPTAARRSAAAPRSPARRPARAAARAIPADAIFTSPDAGIVFLAGTNTAYRTTR